MKKILITMILSALLLISSSTKGAQFRSGQKVNVARGDTVRGDLYAGAQNIKIEGLVQGDLIAGAQWIEVYGNIGDDLVAYGQRIIVIGTVNGDVNAFAQEVRIDGVVQQGVRAGAASLIINGIVKGDVVAGCGQVTISKDAIVEGDVNVGTGELLVEGTVRGSINGGAGRAVISGAVSRDVHLTVDDGFDVPVTATIGGDLKYRSKKPTEIKGAVAGQTLFEKFKPRKKTWSTLKVIFEIWSLTAALVVGLMLVALLKKWLMAMTDTLHSDPLKSLGWGFVFLIGVPAVFVVSLIFVITIPLGLSLLGLYFILLYVSRIIAGLFIGREVMQRITGREVSPFAAIAIGIILVWVLINVPHLGWLFHLAVILFGLGGILLVLRKATILQPAATSAVSS